jgi:dolichyl-diphosphooligosaccharide--protein glycosyltransferase
LLALLLGLAFAVRTLDAPAVFTREGIRPVDPDAYYHLRRIAFTLARFPQVLERDPYLNHPHGGDVIWPPGFDWTVAWLARARLGPDAGAEAVERFTLGLPPLLGLLGIAGVFAFGARRVGPGAAGFAAALLAILPGHAAYSRLGQLDHHAVEPLATLSLLAAGAALLRARGRSHAAATLGPALAFAAALAASFLVWPGLLLQVALVDAVLLGFVLLGPAGTDTRRLALACAGAHALAVVALLPFAGRSYEVWGTFAPVVLCRFQPWLLLCAAAVLAAAALAARRGAAARVALGAGTGLAALAASAALWPELVEAPGRMWAWLARSESFQVQVSESRPLFAAGPAGRLLTAAQLLSHFVFLAPLAWLWHVREAARAPGEAKGDGLLLAALALGLGLAALAQRRFANAFSVPFVLLLGTCAAALPGLVRWPERSRAVRAGLAAAAALALLVALTPPLNWLAPALERRGQAAAGEPLRLAKDVLQRHELHRLAEWMRGHTPETAGFLDPRARPEYGILAPWDAGHILLGVARRPVVVSNFGDDVGAANMAAAARYFAAAEPEASALLDALGARYALLELRAVHESDEGSMLARGALGDGSAASPGDPPAFERHRLVYETRGQPWSPAEPFFKLFEHVAGARVEGLAPPGSAVRFELDLETNQGRRFTWLATARAGADGRYGLRLPYATRGAPPAVQSAAAYRVQAAGASGELALDERDVQEGRAVIGPDLGG